MTPSERAAAIDAYNKSAEAVGAGSKSMDIDVSAGKNNQNRKSINDFTSNIVNGLSRTNRYAVDLTIPTVIRPDIQGAYTPDDNRRLLLMCDQLQLPGLNINTTQIRTYGEIREMPYEFNYDPIQLSFYVDTEMIIKSIFDAWIKSVQNDIMRNFNYYNSYICPQMKIIVEDVNDYGRYEVTLHDVYPKNIAPIQMGNSSTDVMKLSVTLVYKYWTSRPLSIINERTRSTSHSVDTIRDDVNDTHRVNTQKYDTRELGIFGVINDVLANKMAMDIFRRVLPEGYGMLTGVLNRNTRLTDVFAGVMGAKGGKEPTLSGIMNTAGRIKGILT